MSYEAQQHDDGGSPPKSYRIRKLRGYLPLNEDASPMAIHGQGMLTALVNCYFLRLLLSFSARRAPVNSVPQIKSRSNATLQNSPRRRPSLVIARSREDGEDIEGDAESDDFVALQNTEERRLSIILNGPQMRSQRLIGNSNPRYCWERYWKTEDDLKKMKKPLYVRIVAWCKMKLMYSFQKGVL